MKKIIPGFWYLGKKNIKKKYFEKKYKLYSYKSHDYKYNFNNWHQIQICYKKILSELTYNLNKIHKLDWNIKTWEIIVGPWLKKYLVVIFDRSFIANNNHKKKR